MQLLSIDEDWGANHDLHSAGNIDTLGINGVPVLGTSSTCTYYGYMQKTITSDKYLSLLSWLKKSREDRGLSMRELALLIGKPHSWIGKIETAERRLDILEFVNYCKALKLNPEDGLKYLK